MSVTPSPANATTSAAGYVLVTAIIVTSAGSRPDWAQAPAIRARTVSRPAASSARRSGRTVAELSVIGGAQEPFLRKSGTSTSSKSTRRGDCVGAGSVAGGGTGVVCGAGWLVL